MRVTLPPCFTYVDFDISHVGRRLLTCDCAAPLRCDGGASLIAVSGASATSKFAAFSAETFASVASASLCIIIIVGCIGNVRSFSMPLPPVS